MLKQNKFIIIITALITLLPIFVGMILWNRLPQQLPTHWGADGEINGYSGKAMAVFGLPLILTACHLLCTLLTLADPKKKNISGKIFVMLLWICPIISLLCGTMIYCTVLGVEINTAFTMSFIVGIIFIVIGNYLPKCRQNYTVGIKLPWTLASESNWIKTHRFAGPLWVVGGIVIILTAFLKSAWILFAVIMVVAILPTIYSYLYYVKNEKNS